MANYNRVILMGNVTRDLELRYTPGGQAVLDLGLATNRSYKTDSGEMREEVTFVDVVVWGRQAETCHQYLSKGSPLFVEGRLQYESWQDATGQKRSRLRVVAERTQFLGRPRSAEYQDAGGPPPPPAAPAPGAGRAPAEGRRVPAGPPPPPPPPPAAPLPSAVGPEDIVNDEEDSIPF